MVTAVRSETKTYKRPYLLQLQVRNLLCRTTDISQDDLEKIGDTGIANQWWRAVKVYGFDGTNRCHAGLELHINWLTHTIEVAVWGGEVTVKKTVFTEDLAPEVRNAVEVFNQTVIEQCLTTEWRVSYAEGVDVARIRRELGLSPAPPITWAGTVSTQSSSVKELPELRVRLLIAESDELVPEERQPSQKPSQPAAESFVERIKQVLGEF
jgi:hypothetical protein